MALVDFILSCLCLMLWLNWQSRRLSPFGRAPGIALVSTLKRAEPRKRDHWYSFIALLVIIFMRALVYAQLGPASTWTPRMSLGAIVLHFRSDMFPRMLLFSVLGFLLFLLTFYFSLFLIAAANRPGPVTDIWQSSVRAHLGFLNRFPRWSLLGLPFVIGFTLWLVVAPILGQFDVLAAPKNFRRLASEAAIIGVSAWLLWQYVLIAVLALHMLSTYVYLGNARFWNFISVVATDFLRPFQRLPLRVGKIDLLPAILIAVVITLARVMPPWLAEIYSKLPG